MEQQGAQPVRTFTLGDAVIWTPAEPDRWNAPDGLRATVVSISMLQAYIRLDNPNGRASHRYVPLSQIQAAPRA